MTLNVFTWLDVGVIVCMLQNRKVWWARSVKTSEVHPSATATAKAITYITFYNVFVEIQTI